MVQYQFRSERVAIKTLEGMSHRVDVLGRVTPKTIPMTYLRSKTTNRLIPIAYVRDDGRLTLNSNKDPTLRRYRSRLETELKKYRVRKLAS